MNPKIGKVDIDNNVLHDAFFKYQSKPDLSIHGDVYYEGKEDEVKTKGFRPGKLSQELRAALGVSETAPPPWLVHMQRYGPPPSYPNLKIPGLNAPLPEGSSYNLYYNKMDESGKALYQNVYLKMRNREQFEKKTDKSLWGQPLEVDPEDEDFEDSDDYDLEQFPVESFDASTNAETIASGVTSMTGFETPEVELRKNMSKP